MPPQTSQRTNAGGRKFISSLILPAPSHSGQRPCALLKENRLGPIAAQPRLGHLREQLPDVVEEADVGRGNRARRAADGRLVHFVNGLEGFAPDSWESALLALALRGVSAFRVRGSWIKAGQQAFADQGALAGAAHAGHQHQPAQRKSARSGSSDCSWRRGRGERWLRRFWQPRHRLTLSFKWIASGWKRDPPALSPRAG